jgi:hypothetical protein
MRQVVACRLKRGQQTEQKSRYASCNFHLCIRAELRRAAERAGRGAPYPQNAAVAILAYRAFPPVGPQRRSGYGSISNSPLIRLESKSAFATAATHGAARSLFHEDAKRDRTRT